MSFKVKIKDIQTNGLDINDTISLEDFDFKADDYVKFIKPLSVKGKVQRVEDTLISHVDVHGRYESFCARSLERVERDWSSKLDLDFEIGPNAEFWEIGEDIRQEVLTRLPLRVLSDVEMKKEQEERAEQNEVVDDGNKDTYQPFAGL